MIEQEFLRQFVSQLQRSIILFKPEAALVVTFILALMFDIIFKKTRYIAAIVTLIGFIVTGIFLVFQGKVESQAFSYMLSIDGMSQFFKYIILISSFLVVLISLLSNELNEDNRSLGEYYSLIAGMSFGMFLLAGASNLLIIYIAIETMSISSYVLAGYTKEIKRASEASLKYVIYGAVSSGLMIYGISILYGLTGSLTLIDINKYLLGNGVNYAALILSGLLIISGIGYKISAVPFHFWTPDVYEGAPITITAFLSVSSKAAGFAVLIRFLKLGFIDSGAAAYASTDVWNMLKGIDWTLIIAILSVLSMTIGNLVALWQTNLKRLLAYSSIAHAGYMLLGVVVMTNAGIAAVLIYFFFYMFMNLGAFYFIMSVANKIGSENIDDFAGLGYAAPGFSVCMVIFLISLTGLPPTAGFIGKWYIFTALLQTNKFIWLAVIGVLNSVISLFYYVKIFRNMFLRGADKKQAPLEFSIPSILLMLVFVVPTLLFGLYFSPIVNWAESSVGIFLGK